MVRVANNYSAVTGACLMTPRATFDEVGGLSEQFPLNFNDVDYCLKVQARRSARRVRPRHGAVPLRVVEPVAEGYSPWELDQFRQRWRHATIEDPYVNPNFHPTAGSMVPPVYRPDGSVLV